MILRMKAMLIAVVFSGEFSSIMAQNTEHPMGLDELFNRVESNSKSLRIQKTGIEIAQQGIASATSRRLPDINATLSMSYIGNIVMTDRDFSDVHGYHSPHLGNSFSLQAQQIIYAGGAVDAGIRIAGLQKDMAETNAMLTREKLRFMALGQYLDLFKIDNRIKVYHQNIALTKQLIDNIKEKFKQGMALKNDITRYELQMETLNLGLKKTEDERDIINHQLCNTLGLENSQTIRPDEKILNEQFDESSEAEWQETATVSSPVMQQSAVNMQLAAEKEKLAKSEMLPKISMIAADDLNGPITFEIPPINKNLNAWYVGVGISYNISSLFKASKDVKQASIATRQSRESHEAHAEDINNAMQSAYTYYRQSFVENETQKKSVELATQNYQVVSDRYLSQLALVTDMIDASNVKLNAELLEVDSRINIVYAYYRMKYVAGKI